MDIRQSYDSASEAYAEQLSGELDGKPLDRHLLNRFAESVRGRGLVADLGCGPGHVARFLGEQGVSMLGLDISPGMVAAARRRHPKLEFRVEDMLHLSAPEASLAGAVLFYSIVHFESAELPAVFREARRVLAPGALALLAFHAGDEVVHRDELFGAPVALDFRCHDPEEVTAALERAGLPVIEQTLREPYPDSEYPSRRCYLLARAGARSMR